jgi:uncharacterized phage infection (PIP) family protein YhgE
MADLGTLLLRLAADAGQFESDLGRAARIAEKRGKEIERRFVETGKVIGAGLAVAAGALAALTAKSIQNAGALAEMAQKVGASVESLSTLGFAAQQSGLGIEQLQSGLVKLAKNASDTAIGVGTAANGFDALGLSVLNADGSLKATDVLLREVAGKMAQYEDGANKTAIAVSIFGRAGAELIPLLNEGTQGIAALEEQARALGLEIGTNTAQAAEAFGDKLDQLKALATGLGNDIAKHLLPSLNELAQSAIDSGVQMRGAGGGAEALANAIKVVIAVAYTGKAAIEAITNAVAAQVDVMIAAGKAAYEVSENYGSLSNIAYKLANGTLKPLSAINRDFTQTLIQAKQASGAGIQDAIDGLSDAYSALFAPVTQANTAMGGGNTGASGQGSAPAMRNVAGAAADAEKQIKELEKEWDAYFRIIQTVKREQEEVIESYDELQRRFDEQARDIETEIRLLGMDTDEREQAIIALEAERLARDDTSKVIEEQRKRYEALLTTLHEAQKIEAAARQFEGIWTNAIDSVASALADGLIDGFDSGADGIMDAVKNLAKDLTKFWLNNQIIVPLQARMQGQTGNVPGFGQMTNGQYTGSNTAFGSSYFGDSAGQMWGGGSAMGGAMGAAGSIYSLHQIRTDGPGGWDGAGQGAMAGAAAGTQIMPGIGTVIGLVVGALVGYFGGGEPTIRVSDRENDARSSSRLDDVIGVARDRMPEGTATAFAEGIKQFDNAIAGMLDSIEGGADYIAAIRAEIANWSIRVEGDAATVENVLNSRFSAMLGAFDETVRQYVGTAGKVEDRVQRLSDALFMVGAVANGGLVDNFELLAEILGDYRVGTEAIESVYQRVAVSTAMFEEALSLMGISLDLEREGLIRFATDITEAAGGLDRAQQLWAGYFDRFFTDQDRATLALDRASEFAAEAFADIGMSVEEFTGSEGILAFRQLFEQILPTLTAQQVVEWLEAAEALGIVIDAQAFYNQAVLGTAETVVDAAAQMSVAGRELMSVLDALAALEPGGGGGLGGVIGGGGEGLPGPDPRDADDGGTGQVIPGWDEFMARFLERINNYQNPTDPITPPPIDWGDPGGGSGSDPIQDEIDRRYQRELDWLRRLGDLQDSLMLDEQLSTLTPEQMLAEAQAQYDAALAGSMSGDEDARADFDRAARELLDQGRGFFSSSDAYSDLFDRVQSDIASLIAASPATTAATSTAVGLGAIASATGGTFDELKALREDGEDQTVALVERLTAVETESRASRELLAQAVAELKRISVAGKGRVGG